MNPFPGLRPFEADEAHLFFGREVQVERLLEKLRDLNFVAVVGPSGSGKSSLVRAGLLPALHRDFLRSWRVATLRPGSNPVAHLATALVEAGDLAPPDEEDADLLLETTLRRGGRGLAELVEAARRTERFGHSDRLLVLVDQFEELFRYRELGHAGATEAAGFVKLLVEAARAGVSVILTMRSDFLGDCGQFPELAEAVDRGQHLIPRMTREERRRAIEGPVQVAGGKLEPALTGRLLNEAGDDPDALPLLQHALMVLWDVRDGDLRTEDFEGVGGLAEALSSHLDRILDDLPPERQVIAERLFRRLTELGSEGRERRAPARFAELVELADRPEAEVREVIEAFRRPGRSFLMPPSDVELDAETVVDISHESLIRNWRRLGAWVQEERESADTLRRLTEDAWLWRQGRKGLLRDPELSLLERWRVEQAPREIWASRYLAAEGSLAEGLAYLEESHLARQREEEEAERQRAEREHALERAAAAAEEARRAQEAATVEAQRSARAQAELAEAASRGEAEGRRTAESFRRVASLLTVALGLAVFAALISLWANYEARQQQRAAQAALAGAERALAMNAGESARHLASEAQAALQDGLPQRAMLLAAAAVELAGSDGPPESWTVLRRVLGMQAGEPGPVPGAPILSVATSGDLIAFGCLDGGIRLVRRGSSERRVLRGHNDAVFGVAFSPDGKRLASGSRDGTTRLWDLGQPEPTGRVVGKHDNTAYRVAFSPDGRLLASACLDATFTVYRVDRPEDASRIYQEHSDMVQAVAFSPDGSMLATGSSDGEIRLWFVGPEGDLTPSLVMNTPYEAVDSLAFSPDGRRLAAGSGSGYVRVWLLGSEQPLVLSGHTRNVTALLFTQDGQHLASASFDRSLRLWDLQRPERQPRVMTGHDHVLWDVAQVGDGFLITVSEDGTSRLWDLESTASVPGLELREGPDGDLRAMSVGGGAMATGSWTTGTARLWDLEAGTTRVLGADNTSFGAMVAVDPRGTRVAWSQGTWLYTQDLRAAGSAPRRLGKHDAGIMDMALSPDGTLLASTSQDGTLRLWPVDGSGPVRRLRLPAEPEGVSFAPDGKRVAVALGDSSVQVLDLSAADPVATAQTLRGHDLNVFGTAFSPDGRLLATCSPDRTVNVWDLQAPGLPSLIQRVEHDDIVSSVAWSPDGKSLASGSWDSTVRLWRLADPAAARTLDNGVRVQDVAFTPDGKQLVVGCGDATVRWWGLDARDLPSAARTIAGRDFTREEFADMSLDLWAERDLQDGKTGSPAAAAFLAEKLRRSEDPGDQELAARARAALRAGHLHPEAQAAALMAQEAAPSLEGVDPEVLRELVERALDLPLTDEPAQALGATAAAELVRRDPQGADVLTLLRRLSLRRGDLRRARRLVEESAVGLPPLIAEARALKSLPNADEEPLASWRRAVLTRLRASHPEAVLKPEAVEDLGE